MRLSIIREEVFNNIPKHKANNKDLYINIRSGDIFLNAINKNYAQPPLCFYKKIINENNFENIYIVSNGHENPVIDELLKLYPEIKVFHGKIVEDISLSTFTIMLIWINKNLRNLYIYEIINYGLINVNYTILKMKPSLKYIQIMQRKWNNTKEQLDLMINEKCLNSSIESLYFKYTIIYIIVEYLLISYGNCSFFDLE